MQLGVGLFEFPQTAHFGIEFGIGNYRGIFEIVRDFVRLQFRPQGSNFVHSRLFGHALIIAKGDELLLPCRSALGLSLSLASPLGN